MSAASVNFSTVALLILATFLQLAEVARVQLDWREVRKFLSGAFFVSVGVLFYFYLTNTPVPLLGTDVVISPEVNGLRSIRAFRVLSDLLLSRLHPEVARGGTRGSLPLNGEGGEGRRPSPGGVTSPMPPSVAFRIAFPTPTPRGRRRTSQRKGGMKRHVTRT